MILDTNALSAFVDGEATVREILRQQPRAAIPVIVLGEFRYGIAASRHRKTYEALRSELLDDARGQYDNGHDRPHCCHCGDRFAHYSTFLDAEGIAESVQASAKLLYACRSCPVPGHRFPRTHTKGIPP
jgi:predicted nucleic acid-binding protein